MYLEVDASSIVVTPVERKADPELVRELSQFPVALIGDVRQRMGMLSADIRPRTNIRPLAGSIYPILCREGDNLAIHRGLDEVQAGDVLVINALGETSRAVFGGLLGAGCVERGVAGVVIDGSTRDVDEFHDLGLPVYSRGISPAGPYKFGPGAIGAPVACGNMVCNAGDVIIGDSDGVIVLPAAELGGIIELVKKQAAHEVELKAGLISRV